MSSNRKDILDKLTKQAQRLGMYDMDYDMNEAVKEIHEDGFIVIETKIGDITVAIPDAESCEEGFALTVDTNDDGLAEKIIMEFD